MLTPLQAARELGVTRETLYRAIHAGKLKYIRVGGRYRIHPDAIEDFIVDGSSNKEKTSNE